MALQPSAVYHKMKHLFEIFEMGKLGGQSELSIIFANAPKALNGDFRAKITHFKAFQGLKVLIFNIKFIWL